MRAASTILILCVAGLLSLGLVMLFSSGMSENAPRYPMMQAIWCVLGLGAAAMAASIDYHRYARLSWFLYAAAVLLLVLVLIPAIGKAENGARRWLMVLGQSFQPSEFAKLSLVVLLAHYCDRNQRYMTSLVRGLVIPGGLTLGVMGLIFLEPDWGTTLLAAAVSGIMLLVAGARWRALVIPALAACAVLGVLLLKNEVRLNRVKSWLDPEATRLDKGYQSWHSIVAIGSGGVTGLGLGEGRHKFGYVPEHETDFIFAMVGEELGLIGTASVLLAFVGLAVCGLVIAWHARDTFGLLLATGLTFLIGLQAFINMGVATGTLPNKGLPLPFISRGGSNLFLMLVCVGILLSIARHGGSRPRKPAAEFDDLVVPQTS